MADIIQCPQCERQLRVPDELLGAAVKCPTCGVTFTAQHTTPPPLPPQPPAAAEEVRVQAEAQPPPADASAEPTYPLAERDDEPRPVHHDDGDDYEEADFDPHRGSTVLVLGILSLVCTPFALCCGIMGLPFSMAGVVMGVLAWVFGQADLAKMRREIMDPTGRDMTQAGFVCGIIGAIVNGLGLICFGVMLIFYGAMGVAGLLQ